MASQRVEEWRQHWRVLLGSTIGVAAGISVWQFAMSAFIQPLQQAFGWSRGDLSFALGSVFLGAISAPVCGHLADRYGVRPIILAGNILLALCFIGLANNPGSLLYYYFFYAGITVFGMSTSGITYTRAIASWFVASRGLALSTSRIGITVVGMFLPLAIFTVINHFGWRGGYYLMAALALFVGAPMGWFLVTDRRDHSTAAPSGAAAKGKGSDLAVWLALFTNWRILLLCFAIAAGFGPMYGILSQLVPILVGHGIDPSAAAGIAGLLAGSTFVATIVVGVLLDRIWAPIIGFVFTLAPVAGCFLLMSDHLSPQTAGIAIALIGLAVGAEIDIIGFVTARYFGMRNYGAIYGLIALFISLFNAIAGYLFGVAYDRFGGYQEALIVSAAFYALSAVSYLLLGPYPKKAASIAAPSSAAVPVAEGAA